MEYKQKPQDKIKFKQPESNASKQQMLSYNSLMHSQPKSKIEQNMVTSEETKWMINEQTHINKSSLQLMMP